MPQPDTSLPQACAEIQQRCDAASKGPWEPIYAEDRRHMGWVRGSGPLDRTICLVGASDEDEEAANIDFIAHARTDIPYLLAALTALTERNAELEAMLAHSIKLTPHEIQSNFDRVKFAEGLIRQLPENHDGRNTWLLNYGHQNKDVP